jgi:galactokinase
MPKITFIGAGSTVFAKNLLGDILSSPELANSTISLHDIDEDRLRTTELVAHQLAEALNVQPTVETTLDRRDALDGADYAISMFQMDQMISAGGQADHALLIDCRSLETEAVPLPPDTPVVILDTATRRGLVDSAYNERRAQCEASAQFFNVTALRDVSIEQFESRADGLPETVRRRARHVITENDRTLQAVEAMRYGDAEALGQFMNASHASLRDDFGVSSDELNAIVACARKEKGCFGARMTGAGFGGCAVALVRADAVQAFARTVAACYEAAMACRGSIYICTATDRAEVYTRS